MALAYTADVRFAVRSAICLTIVSWSVMWLGPGAALAVAGRSAPPERAAPTCDGLWFGVKTINPVADNGDFDSLVAVSALSRTDAWSVGITDDFDMPPYGFRTLAEHWDGRTWSQIPMPNSTKTTWDQLNGVAAIASNDVWAVGNEGTSPYGSLIEHWDGTTWSLQDDGTPDTYLTSVTGLGPDDVWAAGSTNYVGRGLIVHWDGSSWTRTELPDAIYFRAIDELGRNDVWAVGQESTVDLLDATVAVHFDGTSWTRVSTPSPLQLHSEDENWLTSIAATSSSDIWATGVARDPDWGIRDHPFAIHWDGTAWNLVPTPDPGGAQMDTDLSAVVAVSSSDVWAAGRVGTDPDWTTFTTHWDGTVWSRVHSNTPGEFLAITPDRVDGLWAVGDTSARAYLGTATMGEHVCPS